MDENPYMSPATPLVVPPKSDGFPSERFVIMLCVAILAIIAFVVVGGAIAFVYEEFVLKN
jgi:hypothetical protein